MGWPWKIKWPPLSSVFWLLSFIFLSSVSSSLALTISGFTFDLDGNGIPSIGVNLSGSSTAFTVTSSTGFYSFTVPTGTYNVVPSNVGGYVFTPSSRTYLNLAVDVSSQNFVFGKRWSGGGLDALATNPDNWSTQEAPAAGDIVRFDVLNSTKGCVWNSTVTLNSFQLMVSYSSSVVPSVDMDVGNVKVGGGEYLFGSREIRVSKNFLQTGGTVTSTLNGTLFLTGSSLQTVKLMKAGLGGNKFQNYFFNFRVASSSTVLLASDLILDGSFNISSGRVEAGTMTVILTGGAQVGASGGNTLVWDDSAGTFVPGSSQVVFEGTAWGYQIKQGGQNNFHHLSIYGTQTVETVSNLTVNGNLILGKSGSSTRFKGGDLLSHKITGTTSIGPNSESGFSTFELGTSSVTFLGDVTLGTATLTIKGGKLNIFGSRFDITSLGVLNFSNPGEGTLVFGEASILQLSQGSLVVQNNALFTSTATGSVRYGLQMNGTVDIRQPLTLDSMDKNGFRMGLGAIPVNLKTMTFRNGISGGAALNFDPVAVASVTVDSPVFEASISTNVRAILNTSVLSLSSITVINSLGSKTGPSFENDPDGIVHWGIIGAPTNFSGAPQGVSSLGWSWTINNNPLGFVVRATTGGAVSPTLGLNTTTWVETNLSTNTDYSRLVRAFTDLNQADSLSVTRFTDAAPPTNFNFLFVGVSSISFTWDPNTNPATTVFTIERSTSDSNYTPIASGVYPNINPPFDTGLQSQTLYYYRVRVFNGDGREASALIQASTTTQSVPPPKVLSITPTSGENLGKLSFVVSGENFDSGALIVFKKSAQQIVSPISFQVPGSDSITGIFNLTGVYATTWDVLVENPDGKLSVGTGSNLFTVTDAVSQAAITIQNYSSTSGLTFTTGGGETLIKISPNAMGSGRIYVGVDPMNSPLKIDPSSISSANSNLAGLTLIPGTLREILAFDNLGPYTGSFVGNVNLAIKYPDQDGDGIVDGVTIRRETLRLLTLNESTGMWEKVTGATIDANNRQVQAEVTHFSIYGLFGSPAAKDLSTVKIYPNPWKPGSGNSFDAGTLTLTGLTEEGTLWVTTFTGRKIRKMDFGLDQAGVLSWDGKNLEGEEVQSGVYLILITSTSGEKRVLKLGVER